MPDTDRFRLVFVKLAEALAEEEHVTTRIRPTPDASLEELEELNEFRRAVEEISDPEPQSYTTT